MKRWFKEWFVAVMCVLPIAFMVLAIVLIAALAAHTFRIWP